MNNPQPAAWLTTDQLAAYLETPKFTILCWRRKRVGPRFHKFSRSVRYKREDVDAWVASRAVGKV